MSWLPPPDGSRDLRIEDPTNRWVVHLSGRLLLPIALSLHIPANAVSLAGLAFGLTAAGFYRNWADPASALLGFGFSIAWLVADGLDGMIARATATVSALGRFLDGVCDHAVFFAIYIALASSIGTMEALVLAFCAGLAHAVQATLYEGERTRFHRRLRDDWVGNVQGSSNRLVRFYDKVASSQDYWARDFDACLAGAADSRRLGQAYGCSAAPVLKAMWVLSNNVRVVAIYLACLAQDPRIFWWFELVPLSLVTFLGIARHRKVERRFVEKQVGA